MTGPTDPTDTPPRLRLRGMRRSFGPVVAVRDVDLDVAPGSVHALLGENGAGKSTLMNVVYGLHRRDEGSIEVDGTPVDVVRPADAIAAGLAMVHQHHMLVPSLTVAETVSLATPGRRVRWDRGAAAGRVAELAGSLGLDIDPDDRIEELTLAGRQRVEILTAVHRDAKLLILDEPTAVLAPSEVEPFFELLRRMAAAGRSIVLITHRLREVFAVCDAISVMRRGALVFSAPTARTTTAEVLGHLVPAAAPDGVTDAATGAVKPHPDAAARRPGAAGGPGSAGGIVLEVQGLRAPSAPGSTGLDDCSFSVGGGEILGIAGVEGNGQGELVRVLAGMAASPGGRITVDGEQLTGRPPRDRIAVVPEDRHHDGLVLDLTVEENLVLDHLGDYTRLGLLQAGAMKKDATAAVDEYGIVTASTSSPVRSMSGGNQQKIVLARALSGRPRVLVVAQATRGLDPGAAGAVLDRIRAARDRGTAVVFIGSDLDEVLSVSDRVAVLFGGRIVGEAPASTGRAAVTAWMVGSEPEQSPEKRPEEDPA
ncbi:ABC transporter ATP-binding protein [Herbiconiux sp. CPCC 203407]|uniref:ABC transporter ATP-binding protein n=1 Tax=Herbiconiux oxytropis TaxID=2970915 RepID=A0AA42BWV1_9MICO|nr:ABC transporter ATP-binding protein [Herbiconiux oxytropis]MCS5722365.1 ABC transporter ATP-binding protein [Herbiconiux oxytropis]MCS5727238.1 ABC transporter ATP-binding protein [Herbiconiux oxytropis]